MTVSSHPTETVPTVENAAAPRVCFDTHPDRYRHWRLEIDGRVARLILDVDEAGGLVPGYPLKLNSYDLGVDIELYDAVQRLRFEHPEVGAVVVTGGRDKVFCAGANIRMLAQSSHPWKVNFCKFTNETRNGMEDATTHSGQTWIAALNGTASGGGYELALACERILLVDDGSSAVSLPELPLLGVLPGTGGLTRIVDKRHVRRDLADLFATRAEGVRGETAVRWRLVDESVPRRRFDEVVAERAAEAVAASPRPADARGISLTPLRRTVTESGISYPHVDAVIDRDAGTVTITVHGPGGTPPGSLAALHEAGAEFWPLAVTRELDDLILELRTNEIELGTWVLRTRGDAAAVLAHERLLDEHAGDWLVGEIRHYLKRTLKRLDVSSRSLIALVDPGSCFAGPLLELLLAADRGYMLEGTLEDEPDAEPAAITLAPVNFGTLPMANGLSRLEQRFLADPDHLGTLRELAGEPLDAARALDLGLVTSAPDDIDWEDEVRLAIEERASFSPDALTGMEANLRFCGPETLETKIFARLTAWQNWIFTRPNAAGPDGALRKYGTGQRPTFDRRRV
ncbi:MAG TPA: 2,3-epoxybenzoyl-CoA dihydrolase [Candidatus Dormibacteraeota bacterium]|jgi:benzoyl-CoA-dihydrodiol lyase|nr:2,3-epoxybenzoyl-CoA dihydrolase [Candidatus Dormibacteraeota bacterium]